MVEEQYNITVIRSRRKTLGLEVKRDASVICRAPLRASSNDISKFIEAHKDWIAKHVASMQNTNGIDTKNLMNRDIRELTLKARRVIPERVRFYADIIGVTYGKITIRHQKTRWGSCSSKGNLNFNCLLMLAPIEVIDSVVVHELCHRKHMNHSKEFYAEVYKVCPDYKKYDRWLKENIRLP